MSAATTGRKPKSRAVTGRTLLLTTRDFAVMKDLFFHDRLPMEHIRTLHFPVIHPKTAYNRMNILTRKGYLDNVQIDLPAGQTAPGRDGARPINYFFLRTKARAMMAAILERENLHMRHLYASPPAIKAGRDHVYLDENVSPRPLDSERVAHNYAVAGVYAALKPTLVKEHGSSPERWIWRNERRAYIPYRSSAESRDYRPDAELVVAFKNAHGITDNPPLDRNTEHEYERFHFYFEYQTQASKVSRATIKNKVHEHHAASRLPGFPPRDNRLFVLVSDSPTQHRAALDTGNELGMQVLAGTLQGVLAELRQGLSQ